MNPTIIWGSLETAYKAHAKNMQKYCQSRNICKDDAEEIVHDAFALTFEYLKKGKEVKDMRQFLFAVARNLIIDRVRHSKYRQRNEVSLDLLSESGFDMGFSTEKTVQRRLDATKILQTRRTLKPEEYKLLVLRFVRGFSLGEIAGHTGLTSNAVGIRLHRAMKRIALAAKSGKNEN